MNTEQSTNITFKGDFGTTTTVPADQATTYALTKAGQLSALSSLIASATAGFSIEITQNDLFAFTGLADELANANTKMMAALIENSDKNAESKKGGA